MIGKMGMLHLEVGKLQDIGVEALKDNGFKTLCLDSLSHYFCAILARKFPLKSHHIHRFHTDPKARLLDSVSPNPLGFQSPTLSFQGSAPGGGN